MAPELSSPTPPAAPSFVPAAPVPAPPATYSKEPPAIVPPTATVASPPPPPMDCSSIPSAWKPPVLRVPPAVFTRKIVPALPPRPLLAPSAMLNAPTPL